MDEKELAAQLQSSKDSPDEWGDPVATPSSVGERHRSRPRGTPKRRLAAMVSVRLTPEELELVQARAIERGETVSAYLRGVALRDVAGPNTPIRTTVSTNATAPHVTTFSSGFTLLDGGRLTTRAS